MVRVRALAVAMLAISAGVVSSQEPPQGPPLLQPVRVERVLVDARIVDPSGRELRGLGPDDLRAEIDDRPVRIESVKWIAEAGLPRAGPAGPAAGATAPLPEPEAPGRLVVFLFQKDFFEKGRLKGLLHMKEYAVEFARHLTSRDRAAVLTFDSHLRLHLDFTNDQVLLRDALRHAILRDEPAEVPSQPGPTLAGRLDREAARRVATAEQALAVLGQALEKLPGPKSLVFLCWGLGHLQGGLVHLDADYGSARAALERSRTAVFALDVSSADYHSLEGGLQQVATDTGGFYAKTFHSPGIAIDRLSGALSGHYVLAIEKPPGPRGSHKVAVNLVGHKGTVLARGRYAD